MNRFPRTRAFIAAPLLGTLIFLVAVMFVVHVTQVEKAEVARIVHDVYYNRVVTTLEDFRSDLGTIFSVSVARAVEQYLSNQCWQAFALRNAYQPDSTSPGDTTSYSPAGITGTNGVSDFDNLAFCKNTCPGGNPTNGKPCTAPVPNGNQCNPGDPSGALSPICAEQCNRVLDYHELRYQKCTLVSSLLRNGVCTLDPKYGIPGWIKTILDKSQAGDSCTWASPSCKAVQSAYFDVAPDGSCTSRPGCKCDGTGADCPLSPAAGSTISLFRFEGIKFSIPNKDQATALTSQTACDFGGGNIVPYESNMIYIEGTSCWGTCGPVDPRTAPLKCTSPKLLTSQTACTFTDGNSCAGSQGTVTEGSGSNLCQQLIGDSLFDCRQFAEKDKVDSCKNPPRPDGTPNPDCPFRCCKSFASDSPTLPPSLKPYVGLCCADEKILSLKASSRNSLGCSASNTDPTSKAEAESSYIPGCEAGTFLVNINPTATSQLVNDIPRAQALDESGNVLSGSALADAPTRVAIQYPLYSYLDTAFRVYAPVAYGASGTTADFLSPDSNSRLHQKIAGGSNAASQKNLEGVSEGVCYGKGCTNGIHIYPGSDAFGRKLFSEGVPLPSTPALLIPATARDEAKRLGAQQFVSTFFDPRSPTSICRIFQPHTPVCSQLNLCDASGASTAELWIAWGGNKRRKLCPAPADPTLLSANPAPIPPAPYESTTLNGDYNFLASTGNQGSCNTAPPFDSNKCSFITSLRYTLELHDLNPGHLVNGAQGTGSAFPYNDFCFYLWPELFTPCKINPSDGRCVP